MEFHRVLFELTHKKCDIRVMKDLLQNLQPGLRPGNESNIDYEALHAFLDFETELTPDGAQRLVVRFMHVSHTICGMLPENCR
jgi:hypothetical protein